MSEPETIAVAPPRDGLPWWRKLGSPSGVSVISAIAAVAAALAAFWQSNQASTYRFDFAEEIARVELIERCGDALATASSLDGVLLAVLTVEKEETGPNHDVTRLLALRDLFLANYANWLKAREQLTLLADSQVLGAVKDVRSALALYYTIVYERPLTTRLTDIEQVSNREQFQKAYDALFAACREIVLSPSIRLMQGVTLATEGDLEDVS